MNQLHSVSLTPYHHPLFDFQTMDAAAAAETLTRRLVENTHSPYNSRMHCGVASMHALSPHRTRHDLLRFLP